MDLLGENMTDIEIATVAGFDTDLPSFQDGTAIVLKAIALARVAERAELSTNLNGGTMEDRYFPYEFEVWQGDEMVAGASGPREDALREAMHYAAQYTEDGPVRVFEVTRTLVPNAQDQADGALAPFAPGSQS